MKRILYVLTFAALFTTDLSGQIKRYIVVLRNKGGTPYTFSNPTAYLSQRAIDRRTRYGIAIDSTDLPPTPSYISQIDNVANVTVLNVSRWLNSVSIFTEDPAAITTINSFPFVQSVAGVANKTRPGVSPTPKFETAHGEIVQQPWGSRTTADYFNYGTNAYNEIHLHLGEFLHNIGLRGQGMHISLLDAGFFNYTNLKAFDSVNLNGQVLSTWDFVAGNASVTEDDSHGMMVFSTIGANIPGQFVGKAPKAGFHLFRTEDGASEFVIEEHNWACGAERADSIGSDLISSSLGYTTFDLASFDHPYSDRNGNVAMATIAADLAAKKGLLVFNSVGNIIDASTHFLSIPADGDSVVAVGSVNTGGVVASGSSYGPSADGQIKPDVAAVGVQAVVQLTNNTIGSNNGTSFACPNMAGMTACLWQGFPEFNNMKIVRAIQQTGSISTAPNDRIGYGIPNLKIAFGNLLTEYATSAASLTGCKVTLSWSTKDVRAMKFEIERKAPGETTYSKIGEMNPQTGDILANHNYQFENSLTTGQTGIFSYRIRQVLDTAVASMFAVFIDTASVTVNTACFPTGTGDPQPNRTLVSVQPNPAVTGNTTLVIETPYAVQNMPILIYDTKGRLVVQLKKSKASGTVSIDLSLDQFANGKYYIKVLNGEKQIGTTELIKL